MIVSSLFSHHSPSSAPSSETIQQYRRTNPKRCNTCYQYQIVLYYLLLLNVITLVPSSWTILFAVVDAKKSIPCTKHQSHYFSTLSSSLSENEQQQWNPSPNIDEQGFLKYTFHRILGDWEMEANIGGRYSHKSKTSKKLESIPVLIRQVPGDGNCLFHSLSVGLNYVERKKHFNMMSTTTAKTASMDEHKTGKKCRHHHHHHQYHDKYDSKNGIQALHEKSMTLRQIATDMLIPLQQQHSNNNEHDSDHGATKNHSNKEKQEQHHHQQQFMMNKNTKRKRKHRLFLQGHEYMHTHDLLHLAASQYDLTGLEYCQIMRNNGVWGGGPEIVAICNYLKRPIHVYDLVTVYPPPKRVRRHNNDNQNNYKEKSLLLQNILLSLGEKMVYHRHRNGNHANHDDEDLIERDTTSYNNNNNNNNNNTRRTYISKLCKGTEPEFRLRRMACFGSPKYDHKEPIHILSADSRFPDLRPGQENPNGNHFLAMFPLKNWNIDSNSRSGLLHNNNTSRRRKKNTKKDYLGLTEASKHSYFHHWWSKTIHSLFHPKRL